MIKSKDLSATGFILRPVYNKGGLPAIPRIERRFDPTRDHKTSAPRSLGILFDHAAFSRPFGRPVSIDIQLKSAQSDVYYVPIELAQFREFLQRAINRAHNRSASAFTQGMYVNIRQRVMSPATGWHYDIGSPCLTILAATRRTTSYVSGYPVMADQDTLDYFRREHVPQEECRRILIRSTNLSPLRSASRNGISVFRFAPFEMVEHNHKTLHKGSCDIGRTLVAAGWTDTDQLTVNNFTGYENPMHPGIARLQTPPLPEAPERLYRYIKRYRGLIAT